jgi:anti-anti-sigma factor
MPASHTVVLDAPVPGSEHIAMATFDADLVCTYANPWFADVAGVAADALTGLRWSALFPGLAASEQSVVDAVASQGPPVGEVDVVVEDADPADVRTPAARRRWRLVLHRVEGVPGVPGGRVVSVVGTLAAGPVVLDRPAFHQRVDDSLRNGAAFGVLLVDLGQQNPAGLAGRASALRGVVRTTDVVSLDVDDGSGRSYLALLCPALPAPWTAAAIGDRLRRAAQLTEGLAVAELPQVSVTVARPEDSAESLLRRASASLRTELQAPLDVTPLRTTVRDHAVSSGRVVVVRLVGEADLSTLRGLTRLLEAIVEDRPVGLVLDASQLTFCDVATVRALVTAAERASRAGAVVGVAGMPATMERVFSLGWSGSRLQRWATLEVALASL